MQYRKKISLKEAVRFHGHLGPYLVLGLKAGELALKKLSSNKYFGLEVMVWGAQEKPKSCLIDGLQLATGATYGKGNIIKYNGSIIRIEVANKHTNKKIIMTLPDNLIKDLGNKISHKECEELARKLYRTDKSKIFIDKE